VRLRCSLFVWTARISSIIAVEWSTVDGAHATKRTLHDFWHFGRCMILLALYYCIEYIYEMILNQRRESTRCAWVGYTWLASLTQKSPEDEWNARRNKQHTVLPK
jgi:hypothetical protein